MHKTKLILLVVGIAAAIALLTYMRQSTAPTRAGDAEQAMETADGVADDSTVLPVTPASSGESDVAAVQAAREAAKAGAAKITQAGRSMLQGRYEGETVDPAWASQKQATLRERATSAQIDDANAQPTDFQVQCRRTVCKINAVLPSMTAADDWFSLYALNVATDMPNISLNRATNPDGSISVELYGLARQ